MNRYQKELQLELLNHEEAVKKQLADNYKTALTDMKALLKDMADDPKFRPEKVRRAKYLLMLEAQLETVLSRLGEKNVSDMTKYLETVYHEAYIGCLYCIQKDGVDLVLAADETKVSAAIGKKTKDLKFSQRLYKNVRELKDGAKAEIARGFSNGSDYRTMARQLGIRAGVGFSRAYRIVRTEGHRVENESRLTCMADARRAGADIVKQWDSTIDDVTRATHRELDGQVRELEEAFEIPGTGSRAMAPGGFGIAKEDINCRCCLLQRAKWNPDSEAYKYSRIAGGNISLRSGTYREWKEKYKQHLSTRAPVLPADVFRIKGFTAETKLEIDRALEKLHNEYDIRLHDIYVEPGDEGDIFITGYHDGVMDMVVNQETDFGGVKDRIKERYESGRFAGKSWEDYIAHEMAHVMTYQECRTDGEFYQKNKEVEALYDRLPGMSRYADDHESGNEALAEAFVRWRNGEKLSEDAESILEKYFGRWKK